MLDEAARYAPGRLGQEPARVSPAEKRRLEPAAAREALYDQVRALRQAGCKISATAAQVGTGKRIVERFVQAEKYPARARRRRQPRHTNPFEAHRRHRVAASYHNAS